MRKIGKEENRKRGKEEKGKEIQWKRGKEEKREIFLIFNSF